MSLRPDSPGAQPSISQVPNVALFLPSTDPHLSELSLSRTRTLSSELIPKFNVQEPFPMDQMKWFQVKSRTCNEQLSKDSTRQHEVVPFVRSDPDLPPPKQYDTVAFNPEDKREMDQLSRLAWGPPPPPVLDQLAEDDASQVRKVFMFHC